MIFREAARADLPAIIGLLADDVLGRARDHVAVDDAYERAFAAIDADPRNLLVVADDGGDVVGFLQITYIPGLGRQGIGTELMKWAIEQAKSRGCALVQLTSDKSRAAAHRFYAGLGFVASHEGMKLIL